MKIRTKLFLILAALTAAPLALTAALILAQSHRLQQELLTTQRRVAERSISDSRQALLRQVYGAYETILNDKGQRLKAFFEAVRRQVLLESALVRQSLEAGPPREAPPLYLAAEVVEMAKDPQGEFAQRVLARSPYAIFHLAPGVRREQVEPALQSLRPLGHFFAFNQRVLPSVTSTYVGHRDGFICGYPGRRAFPPQYDPRERNWYKRAQAEKHLLWTDLYLDRDGTTLVFTCCSPVYDASGELLAVAAIDVKLGDIVNDLFALERLNISDAILIDGEGLVRVSAAYEGEKALISSKSTAEPVAVAAFQDGEFLSVYRQFAGTPERPVGFLEAEGGVLYGYRGVEIVQDPEIGSSLTWYYVVKLPLTPLMAPVEEIRRKLEEAQNDLAETIRSTQTRLWIQVVGLTAGVLMLAMVAALVMARTVTRPLLRISEAAQKIGRGDLNQTVAVASRDEIGRLGVAINEMIQGLREREFVKSTFKRYVAATVVEQILKDPERVKLGGERREMTVFFSDLAGFTPLSETMSPEALVTLINEYLDAMTEAIISEEGTIDKYVGDAIVAFWNAPVDQPDNAVRACRAALKNRASLGKLHQSWKARGLPLLDMRIGINTGPMIVGNVGSSLQMGYTVMGDSVNLGSRLEGVNKVYGTRILITEATRLAAGDAIVVREVDRLAVQGKKAAAVVYELLGLSGEVPAETIEAMRTFERGLVAYRSGEWDAAEADFQRVISLRPDETVARVFLERVAFFRQHPPQAGWDGTFVAKEK
jgi:class 3 adenylate cyclase